MTKLTKFDRQGCELVRVAMTAALASVEAEFGVKFKLGNAKFDSGSLRFINLTAVIPEANQANNDSIVRSMLVLDGLVLSRNMDTVPLENAGYKLLDYRQKAQKYPWVYLNKRDGKTYITSGDRLRFYFPEFSKAA